CFDGARPTPDRWRMRSRATPRWARLATVPYVYLLLRWRMALHCAENPRLAPSLARSYPGLTPGMVERNGLVWNTGHQRLGRRALPARIVASRTKCTSLRTGRSRTGRRPEHSRLPGA